MRRSRPSAASWTASSAGRSRALRTGIAGASDDDGGDFELAAPEGFRERFDYLRIEVAAAAFHDDLFRLEGRHRLAVRPIARQRIVDIRDRDDSCLNRDFVSPVRVIPRAVELVVVREHDWDD